VNMAIEDAVVNAVRNNLATNTVRFRKNTDAVIVGCFQCFYDEANLKGIQFFHIAHLRSQILRSCGKFLAFLIEYLKEGICKVSQNKLQ